MAKAFALQLADGSLDIRTVSETQQAVAVNALVLYTEPRIIPMQTWDANKVLQEFLTHRPKGSLIVAVDVTLATDRRPA